MTEMHINGVRSLDQDKNSTKEMERVLPNTPLSVLSKQFKFNTICGRSSGMLVAWYPHKSD